MVEHFYTPEVFRNMEQFENEKKNDKQDKENSLIKFGKQFLTFLLISFF